MVDVIDLDRCPACSGRELVLAFASENGRHNSISRLDQKLPQELDPAFAKVFARLHWTICKSCALIFAARRPPGTGSSGWYLPLFKLSEERGYDIVPLPESYVQAKAKTAGRLLDIIASKGLIGKGAHVLQVRCATGQLLNLARQQFDADVWGLDYFPACIAHANAMLGENRVGPIIEPEPGNPFPQKIFDVIISNHMITHSHDPALLLSRYRQWLSKDGILVVHNELDHAKTLKSFKAYPRGINFFHKQLFTESTFISALRNWGFEPERVRPAGTDARKFEKNMMFVCRKREPALIANGDWRTSAALLRAWEGRRRIAEWLGIVAHWKERASCL